MSRVLLLDTAFAARPVHDWLRGEGFDVWTIGNRPHDVLARRAPDRYVQDNYADPRVVQAHVDRLGIDHVVPGCTDLSIETAQRVQVPGTRLDAPGIYHQIADKAAFRALCARLGLPSPRRVSLDDLPLPGKLIAKPSDAFSGRGMSVVDGTDPGAARRALAAAQAESRHGEALLETYAEGQLHSFSAFIEGQRVVSAVIVREDGSVTPFAVDTSHVVYDFPAHGIAALSAAVQTLAQELHLVDGLLHVQFIWDGQTPWLVELGRRCPGDLYPWLVELSTGQRHAARYASYFVGRTVGFDAPGSRAILRHTVTAAHGSYEGVFLRKAEQVVEYHPLAPTGREAPPRDRIDRVGLMFLDYPDVCSLEQGRRRFVDRAAYQTAL